MAINKAKIFTVASVKGGTGKTTTVLNLAGIFSEQGKKVLIIDLDLYGSAIAASLNVNNEINLYNVISDLNNNCFEMLENLFSKGSDENLQRNLDILLVKPNKLPVKKTIRNTLEEKEKLVGGDILDVIPAPNDPRLANKISSKYISIILARAELKYDVILIDTNHYLDEINLVAYDYSDEILFVMTNDPIDLKSMKTMVSILKDMERDNYLIILNNAKDKQRDYFTKYDIKSIIKDNIDYIIPNSFYIKNIDKYVLDGEILTLNKRIRNSHRKAITNFESLANNLIKKTKKEERDVTE